MQMQLRKATRKKAKLRLGLSAPSGGGKTVSALLMAYGITGDWDKIALIDTENRSGDLYANHTLPSGFKIGEFLVLQLDAPYSPERYIEAMKVCEDNGIEVMIIDSITHEWSGDGGIMSIADGMTGDNFSKWKTLTPRHQAFIDKILTSPIHVITTVRRKQEYALVMDEGSGKRRVEKMGLKEVTREGFDYELTVNLELDMNHNAWVGKDRTGLFEGKPHFIPSVETGRLLAEWCESGLDVNQEVSEAIAKLPNCGTVDEVTDFKGTLSLHVQQDPRFLEAGRARVRELRPKQTDATPAAGDQQPIDPAVGTASALVPEPAAPAAESAVNESEEETEEDRGPFEKAYQTIQEIEDALATAQTLDQASNLYYLNAEKVEANPDLKAKFSARKAEIRGTAPQGEVTPVVHLDAGTLDKWKANFASCHNAIQLIAAGKQFADALRNPQIQALYDQRKAELGGEPAPAVAPAAPVAPAKDNAEKEEQNANPPAVDSTGLPWDDRIHSSAKTLTAEGAWRRKRGVNDLEYSKIEQELRESLKPAAAGPVAPDPAKMETAKAAMAPPPLPVAEKQQLDWFTKRVAKWVWSQGANDDQFTGRYLIEDSSYPEYLFTTLQEDGYTFRDLHSSDPAEPAPVEEEATA